MDRFKRFIPEFHPLIHIQNRCDLKEPQIPPEGTLKAAQFIDVVGQMIADVLL